MLGTGAEVPNYIVMASKPIDCASKLDDDGRRNVPERSLETDQRPYRLGSLYLHLRQEQMKYVL